MFCSIFNISLLFFNIKLNFHVLFFIPFQIQIRFLTSDNFQRIFQMDAHILANMNSIILLFHKHIIYSQLFKIWCIITIGVYNVKDGACNGTIILSISPNLTLTFHIKYLSISKERSH